VPVFDAGEAAVGVTSGETAVLVLTLIMMAEGPYINTFGSRIRNYNFSYQEKYWNSPPGLQGRFYTLFFAARFSAYIN
jgi:hypothetical protein